MVYLDNASVVQWIERWTSKPSVAGSIPARGTLDQYKIRW